MNEDLDPYKVFTDYNDLKNRCCRLQTSLLSELFSRKIPKQWIRDQDGMDEIEEWEHARISLEVHIEHDGQVGIHWSVDDEWSGPQTMYIPGKVYSGEMSVSEWADGLQAEYCAYKTKMEEERLQREALEARCAEEYQTYLALKSKYEPRNNL